MIDNCKFFLNYYYDYSKGINGDLKIKETILGFYKLQSNFFEISFNFFFLNLKT